MPSTAIRSTRTVTSASSDRESSPAGSGAGSGELSSASCTSASRISATAHDTRRSTAERGSGAAVHAGLHSEDGPGVRVLLELFLGAVLAGGRDEERRHVRSAERHRGDVRGRHLDRLEVRTVRVPPLDPSGPVHRGPEAALVVAHEPVVGGAADEGLQLAELAVRSVGAAVDRRRARVGDVHHAAVGRPLDAVRDPEAATEHAGGAVRLDGVERPGRVLVGEVHAADEEAAKRVALALVEPHRVGRVVDADELALDDTALVGEDDPVAESRDEAALGTRLEAGEGRRQGDARLDGAVDAGGRQQTERDVRPPEPLGGRVPDDALREHRLLVAEDGHGAGHGVGVHAPPSTGRHVHGRSEAGEPRPEEAPHPVGQEPDPHRHEQHRPARQPVDRVERGVQPGGLLRVVAERGDGDEHADDGHREALADVADHREHRHRSVEVVRWPHDVLPEGTAAADHDEPDTDPDRHGGDGEQQEHPARRGEGLRRGAAARPAGTPTGAEREGRRRVRHRAVGDGLADVLAPGGPPASAVRPAADDRLEQEPQGQRRGAHGDHPEQDDAPGHRGELLERTRLVGLAAGRRVAEAEQHDEVADEQVDDAAADVPGAGRRLEPPAVGDAPRLSSGLACCSFRLVAHPSSVPDAWGGVRSVAPRRAVRRTGGAVRARTAPPVRLSVALDVDDLPQRVPDPHQVRRVGHHLVDRLVRRRDLVEERVGVPVLDADHRRAELVVREGPPRRRPRVEPTGAVRRRLERRLVPEALDDVRRRAHRTRDEPRLPGGGLDGTLPGHPDALPPVRLALGEVVVAVDPLLLVDRGPEHLGQLPDDAVHHLLPVEQGEVLRPPELGDVPLELGRALDEVGQVGVGELDPPALHQPLRDRDVPLRDLVADAPRPGVQEQPDPVLLVEGDLDEVVAGPERAELAPPAAVGAGGVEPGRLGHRLELRDPRRRRRDDLPVRRAGGQRDRPLDLLAQGLQVRRQVGGRELRPHRDHAAADVHADGRRHDRAEGRDDRPHGRTEPEVGVGHEREVREHERHPCRRPRLLLGVLLEQGCPAQELVVDLLHGLVLRRDGLTTAGRPSW
ncbi:hypothetical protein Cus16_1399 [Curtobacterium sp. ER1/6]|nr:hypothetical protein Cus16_1399 [Curtobacterium sp. ER1/6]